MHTTIQIDEKTLRILKKIKKEKNASSYDEAINRLVLSRKNESLAGFLGKRPIKDLLGDLRNKNERF